MGSIQYDEGGVSFAVWLRDDSSEFAQQFQNKDGGIIISIIIIFFLLPFFGGVMVVKMLHWQYQRILFGLEWVGLVLQMLEGFKCKGVVGRVHFFEIWNLKKVVFK